MLSIWVPEPFRYALWAIAHRAGVGRAAARGPQGGAAGAREHDFGAVKPENPEEALDPHHFAERFGLFLIILLGEVVVEAGQASVDGHVASFDGWVALVAAMILAAALWWLYFDSAAEINLRVLELSGGSPTMARAIFAVGHMLPCVRAAARSPRASGCCSRRTRRRIAYWLPCVGLGIYLLGTRVFMGATSRAGASCGCAADRDLLARPAARDALAARLPVAADRAGGRLRRAVAMRATEPARAAASSRPGR